MVWESKASPSQGKTELSMTFYSGQGVTCGILEGTSRRMCMFTHTPTYTPTGFTGTVGVASQGKTQDVENAFFTLCTDVVATRAL